MSDRIPAGPNHPNMFETLDLIKLYDRDGDPVFFVISGLAIDDERNGSPALDQSYHYDEHSCPTNYIPVEAVMQRHDADPHGCFDYVRSIWKPAEYSQDSEEWLMQVFPEITDLPSQS